MHCVALGIKGLEMSGHGLEKLHDRIEHWSEADPVSGDCPQHTKLSLTRFSLYRYEVQTCDLYHVFEYNLHCCYGKHSTRLRVCCYNITRAPWNEMNQLDGTLILALSDLPASQSF